MKCTVSKLILKGKEEVFMDRINYQVMPQGEILFIMGGNEREESPTGSWNRI